MATKRSKAQSNDSMWQGEGSWMPGLIMIVVGAVFLLRNYTDFSLNNWWALFILIPAFTNLRMAYTHYQAGNSKAMRSFLFWGLFFVAISAAFLLGVDFGELWPAFLILAGLGFLLGAFDGNR